MREIRILSAILVLFLVVICVAAAITSNYRQRCLEAGYPRFTGQLWDPYCVRKGAVGEDEILRLSDLQGVAMAAQCTRSFTIRMASDGCWCCQPGICRLHGPLEKNAS